MKKRVTADVKPANQASDRKTHTADEAMKPYMPLLVETAPAEIDLEAAKVGLLLLWLSDDILNTINDELDEFSISKSKLDVPLLLRAYETAGIDQKPETPSSIAEYFSVTRSSVTSLLDWLENRSYVQRVRHPSDRRSIHAELTDEGRELVAKAAPKLWSACADLTGGLTDRDRKDLSRILRKVWTRVKGLS